MKFNRSQIFDSSLVQRILCQHNSVDFITIFCDCTNMKLSPAVYVHVRGFKVETFLQPHTMEKVLFSLFFLFISEGTLKFHCYSTATQRMIDVIKGYFIFLFFFLIRKVSSSAALIPEGVQHYCVTTATDSTDRTKLQMNWVLLQDHNQNGGNKSAACTVGGIERFTG